MLKNLSGKIIKNIIGKGKQFGGKNDKDGDGIPNKKDCQPNNVMRQDVVKGGYEFKTVPKDVMGSERYTVHDISSTQRYRRGIK